MTERKLRVALLAGGKSGEREVSLKGAAEVASALDPQKYEVVRFDPAVDLQRLAAEAANLDVAFILLHGLLGEDGTVQGFLELLGIPYQGSGVLGSALAMDKNLAKILYRNSGLTVPEGMLIRAAEVGPEGVNTAEVLKKLPLPLVIKPVRQGSSLGMSIAGTEAELAAGISQALRYDIEVLVEEYIRGREITVGVLGNRELTALPVIEIIPGEQYAFFNYEAKYKLGATREVCPAELDAAITAQAQACGITAHRALQLKGYSRTDMMVNSDGTIYVLETNTIPGMTPTSLLPQAAAAAGLPFPALLDRLLALALES